MVLEVVFEPLLNEDKRSKRPLLKLRSRLPTAHPYALPPLLSNDDLNDELVPFETQTCNTKRSRPSIRGELMLHAE